MASSNMTADKSPQFLEAVRLQLLLHDYRRKNQGDSNVADQIRAELEHHWWQLSTSEQDTLEGLAADLNTSLSATPDAKSVSAEAASAILETTRKGDYEHALNLLRENASRLPPDFVAHMRGICWADMSKYDAAIWFFRLATALEPKNEFHDYFLLRAQLFAKQIDDAVQRSMAIVNSNSPPMLLYAASGILFQKALSLVPEQQKDLYWTVIKAVERANSKSSLARPAFLKDAVAANMWRCLAYDQLDQPHDALTAADYVLALDPHHPAASQVRALLRRLLNPSLKAETIEAFDPLHSEDAFSPKFWNFEGSSTSLANYQVSLN